MIYDICLRYTQNDILLISIFNSVMCDEQFLAWMTVQIGYYAPILVVDLLASIILSSYPQTPGSYNDT